jgi:hypothetical protein
MFSSTQNRIFPTQCLQCSCHILRMYMVHAHSMNASLHGPALAPSQAWILQSQPCSASAAPCTKLQASLFWCSPGSSRPGQCPCRAVHFQEPAVARTRNVRISTTESCGGVIATDLLRIVVAVQLIELMSLLQKLLLQHFDFLPAVVAHGFELLLDVLRSFLVHAS